MKDPGIEAEVSDDNNSILIAPGRTHNMKTPDNTQAATSSLSSNSVASNDFEELTSMQTTASFTNAKQLRHKSRRRNESNKRAFFFLATTAAAAATICLPSSPSMNVFVDSFSFNPFSRRIGWRRKSSTDSDGRIVSVASSPSAEEDVQNMNRSFQKNMQTNSNNNSDNNATPSLVDWKVESDGRITGRSINHPLIPDGELVTTASLDPSSLASGVKAGDVVSTIKGTRYELLKPPPVGSSYFAASANSGNKEQVLKEDIFSYNKLPYDQQLAFLEELTDMVKTVQTEPGVATPASLSTIASTVAPVASAQASALNAPPPVVAPVTASNVAPVATTSTPMASTPIPQAQQVKADLSSVADNINQGNQQQSVQPMNDVTPKRPTFSIRNAQQQQDEKSSNSNDNSNNNVLGGVATFAAATTAAAAVTLGGQAGVGTEAFDGAKRQVEAQIPVAKEFISSVNTQVQRQSKVVLPYLEEQIRIAEAKLEEAHLDQKAKKAWNDMADYLTDQDLARKERTTVASSQFNEAPTPQESLEQGIGEEAMGAATIPAATKAKSVAGSGMLVSSIEEAAATAAVASASSPQSLAEELKALKAEQAKALERARAEARAEALQFQAAEKAKAEARVEALAAEKAEAEARAEALRIEATEKAEALRIQSEEKAKAEARAEALAAEKAEAEARAEALRIEAAEKAEAEARAEALRIEAAEKAEAEARAEALRIEEAEKAEAEAQAEALRIEAAEKAEAEARAEALRIEEAEKVEAEAQAEALQIEAAEEKAEAEARAEALRIEEAQKAEAEAQAEALQIEAAERAEAEARAEALRIEEAEVEARALQLEEEVKAKAAAETEKLQAQAQEKAEVEPLTIQQGEEVEGVALETQENVKTENEIAAVQIQDSVKAEPEALEMNGLEEAEADTETLRIREAESEAEILRAQATAEEQELADAARILAEQLEVARREVGQTETRNSKAQTDVNIPAATDLETDQVEVIKDPGPLAESSPAVVENFGGNFIVSQEAKELGNAGEASTVSDIDKGSVSDKSIEKPTSEMVKDAIIAEIEPVAESSVAESEAEVRNEDGQGPVTVLLETLAAGGTVLGATELTGGKATENSRNIVDSATDIFEGGKRTVQSIGETGKEVIDGGKRTVQSIGETGREIIDTGKRTAQSVADTGREVIDTGKRTAQSIANTGKGVVDTGKRTYETVVATGKEVIDTGKRTVEAIEETAEKVGVKGKQIYETGQKYAGIVNDKVPEIIEAGKEIAEDEEKMKAIGIGTVAIGATISAATTSYVKEEDTETGGSNEDDSLTESFSKSINSYVNSTSVSGAYDPKKKFAPSNTDEREGEFPRIPETSSTGAFSSTKTPLLPKGSRPSKSTGPEKQTSSAFSVPPKKTPFVKQSGFGVPSSKNTGPDKQAS
eukprot:CAMPEP_0172377358 /NCGR_PEP_ID=MMETSP1060-20121228/68863_1 /TAXON_ID=37318 /ORGANISM="Pseudo-nitzschia pungens, Strain cf. cingulata" /LENGTH=1413 /DNA_ID=CAMNT_0013105041 /DNA_START=114 /DNA_END=4352 /DNA_ORIENTATION=-